MWLGKLTCHSGRTETTRVENGYMATRLGKDDSFGYFRENITDAWVAFFPSRRKY